MKWKWVDIVELNKVITRASGHPHAIRYAPPTDKDGFVDLPNAEAVSKYVAEFHPFIEANKRTAVTILVCETLENV